MIETDAYKAGYAASQRDASAFNPHSPDTPEHHEWQLGFCAQRLEFYQDVRQKHLTALTLLRDPNPICRAVGCSMPAKVASLTSHGQKVYCEEHFRRYAKGDYPRLK